MDIKFVNDISLWSLLIANLTTIYLALEFKLSLLTIMWVYLIQSIIIGFFNTVKILTLENFSTEGFYINDKPLKPTKGAKIQTALFFTVHYGIFHIIYAIALVNFFGVFGYLDFNFVLLSSGVFFINHLFSFIYDKNRGEKEIKDLGRIMFSLYVRIIPMHVVIMIGGFLSGKIPMIVFLILKTLADMVMHLIVE